MEGLPQNHEFRINPENFHPCYIEAHKDLVLLRNVALWKSGHSFMP